MKHSLPGSTKTLAEGPAAAQAVPVEPVTLFLALAMMILLVIVIAHLRSSIRAYVLVTNSLPRTCDLSCRNASYAQYEDELLNTYRQMEKSRSTLERELHAAPKSSSGRSQ